MQTQHEVFLTEKQLGLIHKEAIKNKHDPESFQKTFRGGLFAGIKSIENDIDFVHKDNMHQELYNSAACGNAERFIRLFDSRDNFIDINAYYGGCEGETFLYTLIRNDTDSHDAPATLGRQNITRFLLKNGADINKAGAYDMMGSYCQSPLAMYDATQKKGLANFFTWSPHYGKNILPIIGEHHPNNLIVPR